jgi:hypothetical protein
MAIFFGSLINKFDKAVDINVQADNVFSIGIHMIVVGCILFVLGLMSGFLWQYVAKRQNLYYKERFIVALLS